MTLKELIEHLQTLPQDLQVAYNLYSEQCLLDKDQVAVEELSPLRPDGWIENKRPDKETQQYIVFPGN